MISLLNINVIIDCDLTRVSNTYYLTLRNIYMLPLNGI